jgi:hypothetical protein
MSVNHPNVVRNRGQGYERVDQEDLERTRDEEQEERERRQKMEIAMRTNIYKSRVIGK